MNLRSLPSLLPSVLVLAGAGVALAVLPFVNNGSAGRQGTGLGACALALAVLAAYRFPLYVRHQTKMCLTSIPLYLLAVLVAPLPAGIAALAATIAGERLVQAQRGTTRTDILVNAGRWSILVIAGSLLARHLPGGIPSVLTLAIIGAALWLGDVLSLPLLLAPISGERVSRIWINTVKHGGAAEAAQYLAALVGVLLIRDQRWALVLVLLPAALVYLAFRREMDADTQRLLAGLADSLDQRDPNTVGHSARVAELAAVMLSEIGMRGQEARAIELAARVHALGRIGHPDSAHAPAGDIPERTARMLATYAGLAPTLEMVRHQQERWDGGGAPARLAGCDIPFGARVVAVAAAYDTLATECRAFSGGDEAERRLRLEAGRSLDPSLVDALLAGLKARRAAGTANSAALFTPEVRLS